jgi:hypothetical protein
MSDEKLDDIKNLLEDLKSIMMLTNQEKIEDAKKKLLKSDSIEETVYKLCDGVNTTVEISTAIQKAETERPDQNNRKEWKEDS